ncbi:hypothetical protein E2C01_082220 [Portunus trituberculatus]|uniref:Uncharacterized protein n=1 Tax=Portunus trituberculatus TaxID=210409 RepID=A0A5B7IYH6_PORTR|nr:hypothetical protein [Portunus trituberculatus]
MFGGQWLSEDTPAAINYSRVPECRLYCVLERGEGEGRGGEGRGTGTEKVLCGP